VDQLINEALRDSSAAGGTATFNTWHLLVALGASFFLSMLLAFIYRQTHRGLSYSVSFVHTMIIMGVTVTVIMMIIGSNIARAFSLVGALSIIRFRTAIKDPRDVAFIFMTMATGMACGTGFIGTALVFTLFAAPMVYLLYRFNIGAMPTSEVLLKVHVPEGVDHHKVFEQVFYKYLKEHTLLSIETILGGTQLELVYSIHFKPGADERAFLDEVRALATGGKVVLLTGQQNVNV
jgi:uncharacterized membrane protein YhiD involved in acid resistance